MLHEKNLLYFLCRIKKLTLFFIIFLYLILELTNINFPALHTDEALPACGSLQMLRKIDPVLVSTKIFNISFPLMYGAYTSSLESYILLPFLWLFGINMVTLRIVPVLFGIFMLIFTYMFLKEFFDRKVAILTLFLLVLNSNFLFQTKIGFCSGSIITFATMGALLSLLKWHRVGSKWYFFLGIFFFGVGLSIRPYFLWFINAMLLLAIIFYSRVKERLKGHIAEYISIAIISLSIGAFLFLYYNFKYKFSTVNYIFAHFHQTRIGIDNFRYLANLNYRIGVFIRYLKGIWILEGLNNLYPYLFLSAFLWLFTVTVTNKVKFSRPRVLFLLVLFLLILLQTPFTLSSLSDMHHLFILYPFIQIIIALALIDIVMNFKKNKFILLIISSIFMSFIFFECIAFRDNFIYKERNNWSRIYYSDSIYSLVKFLDEEKIYRPVVMEWGFASNLIFLSQGRIIPKVNFIEEKLIYESDFTANEVIKDCKVILEEPNMYVFYLQRFNNLLVYPFFVRLCKKFNKSIEIKKVFFQKDNKQPIYLVCSVR